MKGIFFTGCYNCKLENGKITLPENYDLRGITLCLRYYLNGDGNRMINCCAADCVDKYSFIDYMASEKVNVFVDNENRIPVSEDYIKYVNNRDLCIVGMNEFFEIIVAEEHKYLFDKEFERKAAEVIGTLLDDDELIPIKVDKNEKSLLEAISDISNM